MYVNEGKFNALLEMVNTMKAKLELYEKYEHAREKEFRELERDVYRLKNDDGAQLPIMGARPAQAHVDYSSTAGVAWLR